MKRWLKMTPLAMPGIIDTKTLRFQQEFSGTGIARPEPAAYKQVRLPLVLNRQGMTTRKYLSTLP